MPGRDAGLADGLHHDVERLAVRLQVRREAALVADAGGEPALLQDAAQRVEDLGADAERLGERAGADRHHHELLEVHVAVGVRAAVQDVHHRHRQQVGALAADQRVAQRADVLVEGHAGFVRRGPQGRHRDGQRRVRAEARLVGRAVELDQRLVERRPDRTRVPAMRRGDARR